MTSYPAQYDSKQFLPYLQSKSSYMIFSVVKNNPILQRWMQIWSLSLNYSQSHVDFE